ncbi:MAG: sigma-70 family RNA polymerase sigma factor [Ilumatobacteraceae bacterium]
MMQEAIPVVVGEPDADDVRHADFAQLFTALKQPMTRLAYLLTASVPQAEDAVQEAFISVLERWSRIDDHEAYLRRTVVNRCMSWHRHAAVVRKTRSRVATADSYVDWPDEMLDALRQLPPRRRAVVVLTYYERLQTDEISESLGISRATVRSTLHRALAQLKGILE